MKSSFRNSKPLRLLVIPASAEIAFWLRVLAAVEFYVAVNAVEKRRFAGAVAPQKSVDFSAFKGKINIFEHLFFSEFFGKVLDYEFHSVTSFCSAPAYQSKTYIPKRASLPFSQQ